MTLDIPDLAAMEAYGRSLAATLVAGDVIALIGPLGAGKTQLARSIAEGLGCTQPVTSPTFVLIQEYEARLPVYHFDVYRLKNVDEFLDLGAMEYLHGDGVSIIEWADRVSAVLPASVKVIRIEPVDDKQRRLFVQ